MPRLLIVGAGPIGTAAAQAALEEGVVDAIAGVVDPDPEARDQLRDQFDTAAYGNSADVPPAIEGDRALLAFSSSADRVAPEIVRLLAAGYHAVTTCEELAWPERHVLQAMETSARSNGRVIIATGANPGFVMDRFPLLVAQAARGCTEITVSRRLDTSTRRAPLVAKTGRGLTPEEFRHRADEGSIGHQGLVASARLVAAGLGWPELDVVEMIEPVVADGVVTGLHQSTVLHATSDRILRHEMWMAWDLTDPGDTVVTNGRPPMRVEIVGGYHGDEGTSAQVVGALSRINELEPGFYNPIDLPLRPG